MARILKISAAIFVVCFFFLLSNLSPIFSDEAKVTPKTDEELEDAYEKLFIMQRQAKRDLDKGENLRAKASEKIATAEAILREIQKDPTHPEYRRIVQEASDSIDLGRQILKIAEAVIQWAQRRYDHLSQVIARIPKMKKSPAEYRQLGTTLPYFYKGDVKIDHGGQMKPVDFDFQNDVLLPGDVVQTGKDGRLGVGSMFSRGHVITLGPESKMELHTDTNKENLWHLYEGAIHVASIKSSAKIKDAINPRIETPEKIIEASDDAEFDVYVDPAGRTRVEVYKGEVKQIVKKPPPFLKPFIEEEEKKYPLPPKWWEQI